MTNKRCFLVTAYCDTTEKKIELENTLKRLQKYDTDIILFSHYPIHKSINKLTNYSIYDYSNPILGPKNGRSMVNWRRWRIAGELALKINTHAVDYGYAAIQQIKRGLLFASNLGYDEAFVLNYDLVVEDQMIEDFNEDLKTHDSIILEYTGERAGVNIDAMYMAWFGLKIKPFIDNINSITKEHYTLEIGETIAEEYLFRFFVNENSKIVPTIEWEGPDRVNGWIKTSVVMEGNILDKFQKDDYYWFIGHEIVHVNGDIAYTDKKILLLWQMTIDLNVEIYLKGELIHKSIVYPYDGEHGSFSSNHMIYFPIDHLQFNKYVEDDLIKVVINNWEIPRELLILNAISSVELAYNYED